MPDVLGRRHRIEISSAPWPRCVLWEGRTSCAVDNQECIASLEVVLVPEDGNEHVSSAKWLRLLNGEKMGRRPLR